MFGNALTFTATVSHTAGTAALSGCIVFTANGLTASVPVDANGQATWTPSTLFLGGPNTVTATYSGDSNYSPSTGAMTQMVGRADTTTRLVSSLNPSVYGQNVTFTATVTGLPSTGVLPLEW